GGAGARPPRAPAGDGALRVAQARAVLRLRRAGRGAGGSPGSGFQRERRRHRRRPEGAVRLARVPRLARQEIQGPGALRGLGAAPCLRWTADAEHQSAARLALPHGRAALRPADARRLSAGAHRVVERRPARDALRDRARHSRNGGSDRARSARVPAAARRRDAGRARQGDDARRAQPAPPFFAGVHEPMKRRDFLKIGLAAAVSGRLYAAESEPRFLLVFLRGGYDAANVLVPRASDFYYQARPNIAVPKGSLLEIDADWGLHPALADVHALWKKGEVAFVPFAGTDDLSRSHFETQDSIEAGGAKGFSSGFMNRLVTPLKP